MSLRIECSLGVRYYCDAAINGEADISEEEQDDGAKPRIPCCKTSKFGWRWCPTIDGDTGRITNWAQGVTASVSYKVVDDCALKVYDGDVLVVDYEGYVPDFLSPAGEGYMDYVYMDIDANGRIDKWSRMDLGKFISEYQK